MVHHDDVIDCVRSMWRYVHDRDHLLLLRYQSVRTDAVGSLISAFLTTHRCWSSLLVNNNSSSSRWLWWWWWCMFTTSCSTRWRRTASSSSAASSSPSLSAVLVFAMVFTSAAAVATKVPLLVLAGDKVAFTWMAASRCGPTPLTLDMLSHDVMGRTSIIRCANTGPMPSISCNCFNNIKHLLGHWMLLLLIASFLRFLTMTKERRMVH